MQNYYVLSNGRVRRENNTVYIETSEGKKPLPIEDIESLYLYGEVDLNSRLLNFLSQKRISLHVFNYYGFYAGSYYPREYLHSGFLLVHQVRHYSDTNLRQSIAAELVRAAAHSLLRNIVYYERRKESPGLETDDTLPGEITPDTAATTAIPDNPDLEAAVDETLTAGVLEDGLGEFASHLPEITGTDTPVRLADIRTTIENLTRLITSTTPVDSLRGIEGKIRERYYAAWSRILTGEWDFTRRVRRPPDNEVNALISFGNGFLYTVCLSEIYRTQLTPTISYLHEPGARRFSLALDLSEIFKPLIVDRAIFRLLNTNQLKESHFDRSLDGCFLNDTGKRLFLSALEERLRATIKHRRLNRSVSYRHLIRLECYKLIRHLTGLDSYRAFRAWW